jgi:N-acetylmuramic acid 6-phosphate (MurNAc-6-P) etherase
MNRTQRAALAVLVILPAVANAQEKITSGLQQATTWACIVFGAFGVLAIMYAAAKKMWGDPTANQQLSGVVIGGIIGLGASGLMAMLRAWFQG